MFDINISKLLLMCLIESLIVVLLIPRYQWAVYAGTCSAGTPCVVSNDCFNIPINPTTCTLASGDNGVCCGAGTVVTECPADFGRCIASVDCPSIPLDPTKCLLPSGDNGLCCPHSTNQSKRIISRPVNQGKERIILTQISKADVDQAVSEAQQFVQRQTAIQSELTTGRGLADNGSTAAFQANFFGPNPAVIPISQNAAVLSKASSLLAEKFKLDPIQARDGLFLKSIEFPQNFPKQSVPPEQNPCLPDFTCTATKYRSADGSCNNLNHGMWGRSFILFERLLWPVYSGLNGIRLDVNGNPLPNPRNISTTIAPNIDAPHFRYTLMVMQMGQFIDHDITQTAGSSPFVGYNAGFDCCTIPFNDPACLQIPIPKTDVFYTQFGVTCMNFVRSANGQCQLGAWEQFNQITAYLDSSNIYGSTPSAANSLRTLSNGLLNASAIQGREGCPLNPSSNGCNIPPVFQNQNQRCFIAGDTRVNEQTELSFMHTIFLREHNRIARKLKLQNVTLTDEQLYQESRRILNAEYQHIVYKEFLPAVLGINIMNDPAFDLLLTTSGYSSGYADYINAGIFSSFATAGYRLHSLIQGYFETRTKLNALIQKYQLRTQFNNPQILYNFGVMEGIASGLSGQPVQSMDNWFTDEITEHLFEKNPNLFGADLVSLNIQRGRDHGLPSYNQFRMACGMAPVSDFYDLGNYMDPSVAFLLSTFYADVNDIDLFIGGTSEYPASPPGLVGPTFGCIIAEQFRRLKNGDRFWYENDGEPSSFTPIQLTEIKKASLARILCDNTAVGSLQSAVMIQPTVSGWNDKYPCTNVNIKTVNLSVF